jgi:beta-glucanase (GH16 family)
MNLTEPLWIPPIGHPNGAMDVSWVKIYVDGEWIRCHSCVLGCYESTSTNRSHDFLRFESTKYRGNNEPQWYRPDNAEVSSGTLKLTARRESFQNKEFTSARIRSLNKIEIDLTQDTLVEARIKVPDGGLGIWPAFWMMPSPEVTWPLGGEIDIMEFIGREPFFAQGYIHYGAAFGDKFEKGGPIRLPEPVYEDYHVFSIIKTTNKIAWLIDGHEYQAYTADDIEPKYNWPFEQTYYLILNLATGGYWPGYPEESTVFPTTMEVDYVRVYDLEGGKTVPLIEGTRLVHQNQVQVEYCVNNANGNAITWYVPGDASFVASSTSNCILVDFGLSSGYVKASTATSCTSEGSYSMALPVEVQPFYGVDVSVLDPATTTIEITTGSTRVLEVDGASALQYTRSLDLFDNFFIGMDIPSSDLPDYVSGVRKFFLEIKTTTSAPCTQILIQLEDSALALPDNYGVGRHSRYSCLLEPTRNWQRVACDFIDQPDPSVSTVDRVVVLPDLTLSREDVYYFGSIDVAVSGCTSNCEALQTNGPSTNNCRKASKSEAGACNDGINNNYEGYNGNLVTDCADPVCFDIDPVCGGPPPLESSPSPTALATTRDPSAFPSRSPSLPPIVATTDTPSSSTATSMPSVEPSTSTASPSEELPVSVPPTTSSASMSPAAPTTAGTPFDGPAECSLNPSCVGLVDDCCPTSEDIFLCKFQAKERGCTPLQFHSFRLTPRFVFWTTRLLF